MGSERAAVGALSAGGRLGVFPAPPLSPALAG